MAVHILLAALSAYGVLCAIWVLIGLVLPGHKGAAAVYLCRKETNPEPLVRRYLWLYHSGFIHCPMIIIDCGMEPQSKEILLRYRSAVILCTPEEAWERLEQERTHLG